MPIQAECYGDQTKLNKVKEYSAMLTSGNTWRFCQELADCRTHLRKITGQPLDAVFISNMRDEVDRKRFLGEWEPSAGHFDGPRYWMNCITAQNRAINCVTKDLLTSHGRKKAKEQFIAATEWAQERGAKVVLLAAALKRLFGEDGKALTERFPGLLFTIGDNGTMLLLRNETFRAFDGAGLTPETSRIAILGPYGLLGELMTQALKKRGFNLIGAGPNTAGLNRIAEKYGIEVCQTFEDMGKVDAVVACTHSDKIRLTAEYVELIRPKDKKLLVIDVAEPSNLMEEEYHRCSGMVIRQDAGNAYNPNLKYVLGAVTYRMFRLSRGVTFGCFAETLSLASAISRGDGESMKQINWFQVSEENMKVVEGLFDREGFNIPSPRCFGKPVKNFNLAM